MDRDEALEKLNTVYIISKGRPGCKTAETLTKLGYPGQWFIVCGTNDDALDEYRENWGEHVLVFDWRDEITRTDTLDNFGFETMPSGAVPVRNATRAISEARGELRHWQLDDDYDSFWRVNAECTKNERIKDGAVLEAEMLKIAEFGYKAGLQNAGFQLSSEAYPDKAKCFGSRVFNAHNLPSTPDLFTVWRGRMNDDLINAIETYRRGGYEMSLKFLSLHPMPTQSEDGGMTDIYKAEGTVRKSAYPVLVAPSATKLVIRFGRYHHKVNWRKLVPKVLHEKWAKHG